MLEDKQMNDKSGHLNGKHVEVNGNYINGVVTDGKGLESKETIAKGVYVKDMTARWTTVSEKFDNR